MPAARAWQRMLSGRRLDLLDPTPVDIEIEDIAHGLAFVSPNTRHGATGPIPLPNIRWPRICSRRWAPTSPWRRR